MKPRDTNNGTGESHVNRTFRQKWRLVSINNKLIILLTGVIAGATVVYTVVASFTLSEIHSGSIDTHALAEAAKKQAEKADTISQSIAQAVVQLTATANAAAEQSKALQVQLAILRGNFAKEQRPIVIAAIVKPYLQAQARIKADIFWGNYGKTVALRARGRGRIFWGENAVKDAYAWFSGEALEPYPKGIGGVVIPPGIPAENAPDSHRSTLLSEGVITKTDLDWILANDFSAVIVSRQDYFDQLGNHYWTEGCWSHFASSAIPQCQKHNEVH